MDVGIAAYYIWKIGCSESDIVGTVNENFVYLDLKRRIAQYDSPAFATLGHGEIDFYVVNNRTHKKFAVEVKSGKNNSNTIIAAQEQKRQTSMFL